MTKDSFDPRWIIGCSLGLLAGLAPVSAMAEDQPPPATPTPPAAAPEPARAAPAPAEAAPAAATATATPTTDAAAPAPAAAAPEPAPEPPKAEEPPKEEKLPPIDVGAWLRVGARIQGSTDPKKLNDQSIDTAYAELHLSGKVDPKVSWTLNFNANGLAGTAGIMDAIIGLDPIDEFHVWAGQLLVPSDRANFSGPFFMSPWNYPGVYSVGGNFAFVGPQGERRAGRDVGGVVWGDFGKGLFKYYAGVFNLDKGDVSGSPLFTARLNFAPIGKEPGFYHNGTYYGSQNILAIGVAAQSQKNGSVLPGDPNATPPVAPNYSNFSDFMADALAEFQVGDAGVISGEGAFYHFTGDYNPADNAFLLLASYLTPKVGVGKIQPMVRYQQAKKKGQDAMSIIDADLGYVIHDAQLRAMVGFQHTKMSSSVEGNAIQIGLQTIFF
jgi:hypothetical protein